ncbi:hypothetical protein WH47_00509 [Habropoda laboriosa]|uniref:Uncharacterized protein n=1 Tax=Habropoda laboriosa TaxID=597456 RepID=A0A0L7R3Y4_9HYME|nr:hypothetical protein WH47_00509 [Habropoda laboriosa]
MQHLRRCSSERRLSEGVFLPPSRCCHLKVAGAGSSELNRSWDPLLALAPSEGPKIPGSTESRPKAWAAKSLLPPGALCHSNGRKSSPGIVTQAIAQADDTQGGSRTKTEEKKKGKKEIPPVTLIPDSVNYSKSTHVQARENPIGPRYSLGIPLLSANQLIPRTVRARLLARRSDLARCTVAVAWFQGQGKITVIIYVSPEIPSPKYPAYIDHLKLKRSIEAKMPFQENRFQTFHYPVTQSEAIQLNPKEK